ncbi:MAG: CBM96 family carbohydrate-binding protein [Candidatus Limnocylindrales bacterium]
MPSDPRDRVPQRLADRVPQRLAHRLGFGPDGRRIPDWLIFGGTAAVVVALVFGAVTAWRSEVSLDEAGLVDSANSVTVRASADAQVRSYFAKRNYGGGMRLRSRLQSGDNQRSLLRFTLPSLSAEVVSVRLQLYVKNSSTRGGTIRTVAGSWSEDSVTWASSPALDSGSVGRIGWTGGTGRWISVPVHLGGLTSGAKVDLAIVGASSNGAEYASRETGHGPRLVLTLSGAAPTPTPDPAGTPTPTKTPAPTARPTATAKPPTGTSYPVPASIDATGATDVTAALKSFVNSVPDGSTITFKATAVYRLDTALQFSRHHHLTFDGHGATLKAGGATSEVNSLIWVGSYGGANTDITIRDFNLVGNSSAPGVYQGGREGAHGIIVHGSSDVDVSGITVSGVWGDCFYVGGWADTVSFHDSTCKSNGRNGVTITSGRNVTIQRVAFDKSGYVTLDIEPNLSTEGAANVKFVDNTAGTFTDSFFSALGAIGSHIDGVTIGRNTVTGKAMVIHVYLTTRRTNIVVTDNISRVAAAGPVMRFAHVDGLTVTGNVQPLSSGSLASIVDCTGVTYP